MEKTLELDRLNRIRFESRQLWSPLSALKVWAIRPSTTGIPEGGRICISPKSGEGFGQRSSQKTVFEHQRFSNSMSSAQCVPSHEFLQRRTSCHFLLLFLIVFLSSAQFLFFVYCGLFSLSRFLLMLNKSLTGYACGGGAGLTGAVGFWPSSGLVVPFVHFFKKGTLRILGRE